MLQLLPWLCIDGIPLNAPFQMIASDSAWLHIIQNTKFHSFSAHQCVSSLPFIVFQCFHLPPPSRRNFIRNFPHWCTIRWQMNSPMRTAHIIQFHFSNRIITMSVSYFVHFIILYGKNEHKIHEKRNNFPSSLFFQLKTPKVFILRFMCILSVWQNDK